MKKKPSNLAETSAVYWSKMLAIFMLKIGKKHIVLTYNDLLNIETQFPNGTIYIKYTKEGVELSLLTESEYNKLQSKRKIRTS